MDVASEMMGLTYTIVGKTLLGAQVGGDLSAVEHAMETVLTHTFQSWVNVIDLPPFNPTRRNLRFRRAMQVLDLIVYRMIAERRSGHGANRDLFSMLLDLRDEHTGEGLAMRSCATRQLHFYLPGMKQPPTRSLGHFICSQKMLRSNRNCGPN
jgi:cytochrome P450